MRCHSVLALALLSACMKLATPLPEKLNCIVSRRVHEELMAHDHSHGSHDEDDHFHSHGDVVLWAKVESNERDFLDEERSHSTSVIIEEGGDNGEFDFCISALVWIEHEEAQDQVPPGRKLLHRHGHEGALYARHVWGTVSVGCSGSECFDFDNDRLGRHGIDVVERRTREMLSTEAVIQRDLEADPPLAHIRVEQSPSSTDEQHHHVHGLRVCGVDPEDSSLEATVGRDTRLNPRGPHFCTNDIGSVWILEYIDESHDHSHGHSAAGANQVTKAAVVALATIALLLVALV